MVKSGLIDNPAVSHFRLALHLSLAFSLFAYVSYLLFKRVFPKASFVNDLRFPKLSLSLLALFYIQLVYGAFVAG